MTIPKFPDAAWKPRRSPTYIRPQGPQNRSPAVMAQRIEASDALDDFPTPRWATRALIEEVLQDINVAALSCWEPTCGRGFMADTLKEYFARVHSSDIFRFGYGEVLDFIDPGARTSDKDRQELKVDWIVTNPPFRLAEEFVRVALATAQSGVAMLVRTGFTEGAGRYRRLFRDSPPMIMAQFVERVPILKGRVDPRASTATSYCWLIWSKAASVHTRLVWVPPCRKRLERGGDYDDPRTSLSPLCSA